MLVLIVSLFFNLTQPNQEANLTDSQLLAKYDNSFGGYVQYEIARVKQEIRKNGKEKIKSFLFDSLGVSSDPKNNNLFEKISKFIIDRIANAI